MYMSGFNSEWIKKWGLSRSDFKGLPSGEKALVWALKNGKVDETAYVHWAKKHYKCPTLQKGFFDKSVDFNLLKKFSKTYSWNSDCYPVHIWKGRLLVACLEPPEKLKTNSKLCFAIAPFSAMDKAWKDYHKKEKSGSVSDDFSSMDDITEDVPVLGKASEEKKPGVLQIPKTETVKEKKPGASQAPKTASDFDLSPLEEITEVSVSRKIYEEKKSEVSSIPETGVVKEKKPGTSQVPRTEAVKEKKPGALHILKTETLKEKKLGVSFISGTEAVKEKKPEISSASSQTSSSSSKFIITDQDLFAATDVNKCKSLKQIISYIFYYLKEDYKKLMFVECAANGQYLPRFVYGDWHITDLTWKTSVNITDPNIFRIVYNSKLPFHGTIVDNEFNKRYYQWWTNNKRPDFATVYPFHYNQFLYGFLVCFERTLEFDQNITLKKIKNLLSISKTRFLDTYKQSKTSS